MAPKSRIRNRSLILLSMLEEIKQTVLVVDDHEAIRKQLYWALEENYRVLQADSRNQALSMLETEPIDVVLCDLRMPPVESDITEGLAILEFARKLNPLLPVIVITGDEDRETAIKVVQRGAYDLFHKPFNIDEVEIIVRRAANHYSLEQDNLSLRNQLGKAGWQEGIVGSSPGPATNHRPGSRRGRDQRDRPDYRRIGDRQGNAVAVHS